MRKHFANLLFAILLFAACAPNENKEPAGNDTVIVAENNLPVKEENKKLEMADAATILGRKEVPILCYHQIRNWTASDSKGAKDYIIPEATFRSHLKLLADSGYTTILPNQLYDYLAFGKPLPAKPVMLTFDDTDDDQYTIAAPEMKKYGFKGVFFIMTVSINRPRYMTAEQIKQLSQDGHIIESHTWDHHSVKGYETDEDYLLQIEKPQKRIEEITGNPSIHFAYPFGLWKKEAIPELKERNIKSAYILSTKRDPDDPLYTIRRIIASGYWSADRLYRSMQESFH